MLRCTDVKLELVDMDMYLMMEKGIRCGISMISQKYAKANNPYVANIPSREAQQLHHVPGCQHHVRMGHVAVSLHESKNIVKDELSPYSQRLLEELVLTGKPTEKLIPVSAIRRSTCCTTTT